MTLLLRSVACLLAAAYVVSAAWPCAPTPQGGGLQTAGAHAATSDDGEPGHTIQARCPCGCDKNPVRSGGRLGFALAKSPAQATTPVGHRPLATSAPRLPAAPPRTLDPVPV